MAGGRGRHAFVARRALARRSRGPVRRGAARPGAPAVVPPPARLLARHAAAQRRGLDAELAGRRIPGRDRLPRVRGGAPGALTGLSAMSARAAVVRAAMRRRSRWRAPRAASGAELELDRDG